MKIIATLLLCLLLAIRNDPTPSARATRIVIIGIVLGIVWARL